MGGWSSSAIGYSILSLLLRLWRAHSIFTFSAVMLEPPLEYGMSWSKCSSSVAPQMMHLPLSLTQTSFLISVGIMRDRPLSWGSLSVKLSMKPSELIKKLMSKKIFANINQSLDEDVVRNIAREHDGDPPDIGSESHPLLMRGFELL